MPVPSPDKAGGLAAGRASSRKNRSQTNHEGADEGLPAPATPTNGNGAVEEEEEGCSNRIQQASSFRTAVGLYVALQIMRGWDVSGLIFLFLCNQIWYCNSYMKNIQFYFTQYIDKQKRRLCSKLAAYFAGTFISSQVLGPNIKTVYI